MEQELVTLTQPTADDIPLLAGGRLRIAHTTNAAHGAHYSTRTIRNPNNNLQDITPNILHHPLTPTHNTLPRPFTAAKSRYRDIPRHSWQAIRLFATECSDAQFPEADNRFPAEENAADFIATLRCTQNITRANDTHRCPINIRYLYRVKNTKENCTYDLLRDHFVTKLGIVSTHYPIEAWTGTDDDIFGNEENTVHDTAATPTFLPGGERTGDKSPETLQESSSRDKRISSRDDALLYGNENTTDLAIDILPSGLNDRREKYHFTARGKFRKYRHE
ncbi:hypothetical protein [uncultured Cardiobacterium sp.]|uniref:hypothetical protein n=1 Tax=uncultured Cardiobacterium sp. TaxID=417619 RepID=UPI002634A846|nr:hypothetical protein [uncultured Cardiobacterium sp.]